MPSFIFLIFASDATSHLENARLTKQKRGFFLFRSHEEPSQRRGDRDGMPPHPHPPVHEGCVLETSPLSCAGDLHRHRACLWTALSNSITVSRPQPSPGPSGASSSNYSLTGVTTLQTRLLCEQPAGSAACSTSAQLAHRQSEGMRKTQYLCYYSGITSRNGYNTKKHIEKTTLLHLKHQSKVGIFSCQILAVIPST